MYISTNTSKDFYTNKNKIVWNKESESERIFTKNPPIFFLFLIKFCSVVLHYVFHTVLICNLKTVI